MFQRAQAGLWILFCLVLTFLVVRSLVPYSVAALRDRSFVPQTVTVQARSTEASSVLSGGSPGLSAGDRVWLDTDNAVLPSGVYAKQDDGTFELEHAGDELHWVVVEDASNGSASLKNPGAGFSSGATVGVAVGSVNGSLVIEDRLVAQEFRNTTLTTAAQPNVTQLGPLSANLDLGGFLPVNVADPVAPHDLVTRKYADESLSGVVRRADVVTVTGAPLPGSPVYANGTSGVGATLSGVGVALGTFFNVTPADGDRLLVDSEANPAHNGVYVVTQAASPYVLTRATDMDNDADTRVGTAVMVSQGDFQSQTFILNTAQSSLSASPIVVVGTDPMTWTPLGLPVFYHFARFLTTETSHTGNSQYNYPFLVTDDNWGLVNVQSATTYNLVHTGVYLCVNHFRVRAVGTASTEKFVLFNNPFSFGNFQMYDVDNAAQETETWSASATHPVANTYVCMLTAQMVTPSATFNIETGEWYIFRLA